MHLSFVAKGPYDINICTTSLIPAGSKFEQIPWPDFDSKFPFKVPPGNISGLPDTQVGVERGSHSCSHLKVQPYDWNVLNPFISLKGL